MKCMTKKVFRFLRTFVQFLFVCGVSFGGGLLNHIRGGWLANNFPTVPPDDAFTHLLLPRLVWSVPLGIYSFLLIRKKHAILPSFILFLYSLLSLYIGWGTYLAIGHNRDSYESRPGVFDGILGPSYQPWDYPRRYVREVSGMCLRGLAQTIVPGLVWYSYGYGCTYLLSGIMMGFIYSWSYDLSTPTTVYFPQGVPLAEVLWGTYTWFVIGVSICSIKRRSNARIAPYFPKGGVPYLGVLLINCCNTKRNGCCGRKASTDDNDDSFGTSTTRTVGSLNTNNYSSSGSNTGYDFRTQIFNGTNYVELIDDTTTNGTSSSSSSLLSVGGFCGKFGTLFCGSKVLRKIMEQALHFWILIFIGTLVSCIDFYEGIQQSDQRDKEQGEIGLFTVTITAIFFQLLYVYLRLKIAHVAKNERCDVTVARDEVAKQYTRRCWRCCQGNGTTNPTSHRSTGCCNGWWIDKRGTKNSTRYGKLKNKPSNKKNKNTSNQDYLLGINNNDYDSTDRIRRENEGYLHDMMNDDDHGDNEKDMDDDDSNNSEDDTVDNRFGGIAWNELLIDNDVPTDNDRYPSSSASFSNGIQINDGTPSIRYVPFGFFTGIIDIMSICGTLVIIFFVAAPETAATLIRGGPAPYGNGN